MSNKSAILLDDPRLDVFRDLVRGSVPREMAIVEGEVIVRRLLNQRVAVEAIVCAPNRADELADLAPPTTPVFVLASASLRELVGFAFHRGCLAAVRRPPSIDLAQLRQSIIGHDEVCIVAAAEVADPVNVGALVRNAAAFGARACVFDRRGGDPFSRRAIRAAMGYCFTGSTHVVDDLPSVVHALRHEANLRVYAATLGPASTPLARVRWAPRKLILLGHEGHGLSPELVQMADECVGIPMAAGVDSLNVAAASAVILYAATVPRLLRP